MAGLKYWVWLSEVKGLTNHSKLLLLDHFGSPENIFYADEDEYRLVEGIEPRQSALLAEKSMEDADRILGACSRLGLRLLTMQDADYPVRLRNIFEPPCSRHENLSFRFIGTSPRERPSPRWLR